MQSSSVREDTQDYINVFNIKIQENPVASSQVESSTKYTKRKQKEYPIHAREAR